VSRDSGGVCGQCRAVQAASSRLAESRQCVLGALSRESCVVVTVVGGANSTGGEQSIQPLHMTSGLSWQQAAVLSATAALDWRGTDS
jgi:hypothetical protein